MAKGLPIMAELRDHFSCPVLTDVHEPWQCAPTAEVVDVLQIPGLSLPADRSDRRGGLKPVRW